MHAVVGILDRRETLVISRQIPHRCTFGGKPFRSTNRTCTTGLSRVIKQRLSEPNS
ncbi:unnamed protein product [Chondrus crispus]|uniref:Uncharacterized protein n=1 Tax=Chondrus crispus TaxID=2769 RepID=R7Q2W0_CHOCR|nr:unnamed protein product [Chondrus crispus]CDF32902.1 unnamed protein product [Chondrus crispus]|eukprot:XP_005712703.1 unnamed protein product [Chondrus crispus]